MGEREVVAAILERDRLERAEREAAAAIERTARQQYERSLAVAARSMASPPAATPKPKPLPPVVTRKEVQGFVDGTAAALEALVRKITALEAKVVELESTLGNLRHCGGWIPGIEYQKGNFVSFDNSCWYANCTTLAKPGTSADWRLCARRGADGKAGRALPHNG